MELEEAIRTRRTHKVYGPEPVGREVLAELLAWAGVCADYTALDEAARRELLEETAA